MVGLLAVTTTSDTFPAVLMGIPGTAGSQATVMDGFPMSKRGEATRAISAGLVSSIFGGLVGGVDAALYWSVGWLIDILDNTSPETLLRDHWHQLAGLAALLLVVRAVVMIGSAVIEQQVIVPRFYTMIRWQAFRRVIEQPYTFYQNDFAGRIATKIMQAGESTGDFIVTSLQAMWSFLTFVILTTTILTTLDWRMGVVVAVWGMGYAAIIRFLLPRLRRAGKENANERAVLNGRMVDIFTNILSVKLFDSRQREHGGIRQARTNYLSAVTHLTLNMPGKLTDSEFDTMREQPEAGASLNRRLQQRLDGLGPTAFPEERGIVVMGGQGGQLLVAGQSTAADAMLQLVGLPNAAAALPGYRPVGDEGLLTLRPTVVVVPDHALPALGGLDGLRHRPALAGLTPTRFVVMESLLLLGMGPRLGEAVQNLAAAVATAQR